MESNMMKKKNRPLKLLGVCRVSSREQSEGYSLEAQNQANHEWAERKGYEIVDTIREMEQKGELEVRRPDNPEEVVRIPLACAPRPCPSSSCRTRR